jgi:tetratricopeptide (TPR) repeat protein
MSRLVIILLILVTFGAKAQTKPEVLSEKDAKEVIDSLKLDNTIFLRSTRDAACKCIDKIKMKKKSQEKISGEIKKCIDDEVSSYQLMQKLMGSMKGIDTSKSKTITINVNKSSDDYKTYYYEIERELRDSCESLKTLLSSNEKQSKNSVSGNDDAKTYYSIGQDAMKAENYEDAVKYFTKAVTKDSKFAFAWDNLGVSYRKLGKYDEAINAYNKSLEVDPKGGTALQNLPLVYVYKKEYEKAIESYKKLVEIHPDDPEGYYGIGQAYIYLKDYEKSLDYMCKSYNLYVKMGSPYRSDAEKIIQSLYNELKKQNKEESFNKILKANNIRNTDK